jgi:hypothetical protein
MANSSNAACRSSTISAAITLGAGRLAASSRLSSLSQKIQAGFVALHQFGVRKDVEAVGLLALGPVLPNLFEVVVASFERSPMLPFSLFRDGPRCRFCRFVDSFPAKRNRYHQYFPL